MKTDYFTENNFLSANCKICDSAQASVCIIPVSSAGKLSGQSGITLFTSLIFLIMLTLLGLSVADMSSLEEHMASNTRNRDIAYQAAEAALKYVENNLTTISGNLPAPTNTTSGTVAAAGLRAINVCLPNSIAYWNGAGALDCSGNSQTFTWNTTNAIQLTSSLVTLNQVPTNGYPYYLVERYPDNGTTQQYRVTAYGIGGDGTSIVILQAMFQI
jgi:type IV pilus assembly protein PilX